MHEDKACLLVRRSPALSGYGAKHSSYGIQLTFVIDRSSVAENEVDGSLDEAFLEKMAAGVVAERVLSSVEAAA